MWLLLLLKFFQCHQTWNMHKGLLTILLWRDARHKYHGPKGSTYEHMGVALSKLARGSQSQRGGRREGKMWVLWKQFEILLSCFAFLACGLSSKTRLSFVYMYVCAPKRCKRIESHLLSLSFSLSLSLCRLLFPSLSNAYTCVLSFNLNAC